MHTSVTWTRAWDGYTRAAEITLVRKAVFSFKYCRHRVGHDEVENAGDHGEGSELHGSGLVCIVLITTMPQPALILIP